MHSGPLRLGRDLMLHVQHGGGSRWLCGVRPGGGGGGGRGVVFHCSTKCGGSRAWQFCAARSGDPIAPHSVEVRPQLWPTSLGQSIAGFLAL